MPHDPLAPPGSVEPKTNVEEDISVVSAKTIITVDELKKLFLFGLPLADEGGNDFPDEAIFAHIEAAQEEIERSLDIVIVDTPIHAETHDFHLNDYAQWFWVQLYKKPVFKVERLNLIYGTAEAMDIPLDWVKLNGLVGQFELFPTVGSLASFAIGQGGTFLPLITRRFTYAPSLIQVDYRCGWSIDKVPKDLKFAVGKKAAIGVLNILGDILLGAGIASVSLSVDGMSQSVSTTQSAENSAYSARIRQYERELKEYMKRARPIYSGVPSVVI